MEVDEVTENKKEENFKLIIGGYLDKYHNAKQIFIEENSDIKQQIELINKQNNVDLWDEMDFWFEEEEKEYILLSWFIWDEIFLYWLFEENDIEKIFSKIIENKWNFTLMLQDIENWVNLEKEIRIKKLNKKKVNNKNEKWNIVESIKTTLPIKYTCDLNQILEN